MKHNLFTQGKAYRFLYDLHSMGLLFHLDDDPETVINSETKSPTFTPDEVQILQDIILPALFSTPLPNYGNDPHRICLDITNPTKATPRILPQWGFSFDDEPNNDYIGFTSPKRWNGWGCPLLRYEGMKRLLDSSGYSYGEHYQFTRPGFPAMATFLITGCDGELYLPEEMFCIEGELVTDTEGAPVWVYDTSTLGLCFNIDDCQETNAEDWVGYF